MPLPPVALFSKVCQEANLNFEGTADLVKDAGLDGIDCPVRPNGQVLPERVNDDLPRLAEVLQRRGRKLLLLTTAIRNTATPHAEKILRAARDMGVKYYRLGYWNYRDNSDPDRQLAQIVDELKDLAALNRELGVCGLLQNHEGKSMVGAKVRDLYEIARHFSPSEIAIAFDIGHALNEIPTTWQEELRRLQSHLGVGYIKDWKRGSGFVPFGEGGIGSTDFFARFKARRISAPLSMHTEYHWDTAGTSSRGTVLLKALQRDLKVLRQWWEQA